MKRSWTVHTHMVTIQQYTSTVIGKFFSLYICTYIYQRIGPEMMLNSSTVHPDFVGL